MTKISQTFFVRVFLLWCIGVSSASAAEESSDRTVLHQLKTKTVVMNNRYVRVPYSLSDVRHRILAELLPDDYVLEVTAYGGKLHAYIADETKKTNAPNILSGRIIDIDPRTWKTEKSNSHFELGIHGFVADDRKIWSAFLWFARQTAEQNGVSISRSEQIFFVPGKSFRFENKKLVLKYFRGKVSSDMSNVARCEHYATLELDGVYGIRQARQKNLPDKK